MSSQKGGGGRERTGKSNCQSQSSNQSQGSNQSHAGKSEAAVNGNKHQAAADQMYLASLSSDKSGIDSEMAKKIAEISDMTGRTVADTWMALHDCDNDIPRAVDLLLDGHDEQNEWQDVCKKKKTGTSSKTNTSTTDGTPTEEGRQRGTIISEFGFGFLDNAGGAGDDSSSRRSKVAPRFSRGRGKSVGVLSHNNNEDRQSRGFGGSSVRGQGRGRGRGSSMGAPRNLTRTGGYNSDAGISHIETWNTENDFSSQIDSSSTLPPVGSWGDTVEELERAEAASNAAKVQINGSSNSGASHSSDGNTVRGGRAPHVGGGDQRPVGSRGIQLDNRGAPGLAPHTSRVPGGTSLMGLLNVSSSSLGTTPGGSSSAWSGASHGISSSHSASQGGFDLSKLFSIGSSSMNASGLPASGNSVYGNIIDSHHHQQQHHNYQHQSQHQQPQIQRVHQAPYAGTENAAVYSQFAKEATEVIKNAVGIGSNIASSSNNTNSSSGTSSRSQLQQGAESANQRHAPQSEVRQDQQQRVHSKLPSAAAEVPANSQLRDTTAATSAGRDSTQFSGGWEPPARNSAPLGFSAIGQYPGQSERSNFGSGGTSLNHILPVTANQPAPIGPPMAMRLTLEDLGISTSSVQSAKVTSVSQSSLNYDAINQSSFSQLSTTTAPIGYRSSQATVAPPHSQQVSATQPSSQMSATSDAVSQQKSVYDLAGHGRGTAVDSVEGYSGISSTSAQSYNNTIFPSMKMEKSVGQYYDGLGGYSSVGEMYGMKQQIYSASGGLMNPSIGGLMNSAGNGAMMNPTIGGINPQGGGLLVGDAAVVGAYLSADGSLVDGDTYHGMYGMGAEYQSKDKMAASIESSMSRVTLSDTNPSTQQQTNEGTSKGPSEGSTSKSGVQAASTSIQKSATSTSSVVSTTAGASKSLDTEKSNTATTAVSGTSGTTQPSAITNTTANTATVPLGAAPVYNQNYYIGQPPGFQQFPAASTAAAYGRYAPTQQSLTYSYEETQQLLQQQQQALSMTAAPAGFYDLPFSQHQTGLPLSANSASFSSTLDAQSLPTLPFPPGVISSTVGGELKLGGLDPILSGLVPGLHQPVNQMYGAALQPPSANQQQPYGTGLQPTASQQQAYSTGLQPTANQQQAYGSALQPSANQQQTYGTGLQPTANQQPYQMLPPGYGYYYPNTAMGVPMGSYYTPMMPMNNVPVTLMPGVQQTDTVVAAGGVGMGVGGSPATNSQYQKSVLYGSSTYRGPAGDDYMRNHVGNHRPANMAGMPMTSYEADNTFQMNTAPYMQDRGSAQGSMQKISAGGSSSVSGSRAYNPTTVGQSWNTK